MRLAFVTACLFALPATAAAQSYDPATITPRILDEATYSQSFNGIANSGATSNALPRGWQIVETGSTADTTYGVSDGSSNVGNSYSFGAAGSVDRALGSIGGGNMTVVQYGAIFVNALGGTITDLTFSYFGEQWRIGDSPADGLTFQYRIGATSVGEGAGIDEVGWTTVAGLGFASPQTNSSLSGTAINGNAASNRTLITGTISGLSVADGQTFGFRWVDLDSASGDAGLAVDDIMMVASTATAVPEPATWAMMLAGFALVSGATRRRGGIRRVLV